MSADLTSLCKNRRLLRKLAELPRQQVTSRFSCMIFIISHMAFNGEKETRKTVSGDTKLGQERTTAPFSISGWKISPEEDEEKKKKHMKYSLSGVQSVKRGTKRGTLSMFFK